MIKGVYITDLNQVDEVASFCNAVAFTPTTLTEMEDYLDKIDGRMTAVIAIDNFFKKGDKYFYEYDPKLNNIILTSPTASVFLFDEPLWKARHSGQPYNQVLDVMDEVRCNFTPEIMHIEAFAELYKQYMENNGEITFFFDADHVGFDCYGRFDSCGGAGVPPISQMTYLTEIYNALQRKLSGAKIFLVPGAFLGQGNFANINEIVEQLHAYKEVFDNHQDLVSGIGVFTWGDVPGTAIKGARNYLQLRWELMNLLKD